MLETFCVLNTMDRTGDSFTINVTFLLALNLNCQAIRINHSVFTLFCQVICFASYPSGVYLLPVKFNQNPWSSQSRLRICTGSFRVM
jgi:hypothetical protein